MVAPSRALAVRLWPLTLSMVARTRTVCGCCACDGGCAATNPAAPSNARALAPRARRVILRIGVLPIAPAVRPARQFLKPRSPLGYSGRLVGGSTEIGLQERAQFGRHLRLLAEPQRKAAYSLIHEHTEPVGGVQATPARGAQEWRQERHVNEVGDNSVTGQFPYIKRQFGLPRHAERRSVHHKAGIGEHRLVAPVGGMHGVAETLAQVLGSAVSAVDERNMRNTAPAEAADHAAGRAAGPEYHRLGEPAVPLRRASIQIVQKPFDVGIGRTKRATREPKRVGGAHRPRALVGL